MQSLSHSSHLSQMKCTLIQLSTHQLLPPLCLSQPSSGGWQVHLLFLGIFTCLYLRIKMLPLLCVWHHSALYMLHLLSLYSIPLPIIYKGECSMQTKHCMLILKGVGSFSLVLWLFCFGPGPLCCTGRNYAKYSEGIGANPVKILKVSAHVSSTCCSVRQAALLLLLWPAVAVVLANYQSAKICITGFWATSLHLASYCCNTKVQVLVCPKADLLTS